MEKKSPLTLSQNGVYYENYQNPEATMYNITERYKFVKEINAQKLFDSLKKLCTCYESFATVIRNIDGTFYNVVDEDKREIYIEERVNFHNTIESEIKKITATYIHHFELENSPLFYIDVYKTESSVYLFLDIHHSLWDGSSNSLFFASLKALYEDGAWYTNIKSYGLSASPVCRIHPLAFAKAQTSSYPENIKAKAAQVLPYVRVSLPEYMAGEEEDLTMSMVYMDILTYADEMINRFITGSESMDNFDAFVAKIESMGIQEVIDLKQAQYDRNN